MKRLLWLSAGLIAGGVLAFLGSAAVSRETNPVDAAIAPGFPAGSENSSVLLFNPTEDSASVVLSYYDTAGTYLAGDACPGAAGVNGCTSPVPPGQSVRFDQFYSAGLSRPYRGSGTLASDQPLHALVIKNIQDDSSGSPAFLSYSIEAAGSRAYERLSFPLLKFGAGGWGSRYTVQNTSDSQAACIGITYYDRAESSVTSPAPGEIPNQGRCPNGGWAILPLGTLSAAGGDRWVPVPAGFDGSAVVESLANGLANRVPLVGEADLFSTEGRQFDSYPAQGLATLPDGSASITDADDDFSWRIDLPLVQSGALDGPGAPWTTRIRVMSSDPGRQSMVWALFTGTGRSRGKRAGCRIIFQGAGDDGGCPLPKAFIGYATLRSATPFTALVERSQLPVGSLARYAVYPGQAAGTASTQADLPLLVSEYWTGWTSTVRILAPDGVPPVLRIELLPKSGDSCIKGPLTKRLRLREPAFTLRLAARGYFSPWPGGRPGGCFYGAMRISADRPITAVASLSLLGFRGDIEAMYRATRWP